VKVLLDPGSKVAKSYGTVKYPETYWIDPQGGLQFKFIGPRAWKQQQVLDFFKALVGQHKT
jgi:hypothetical protein